MLSTREAKAIYREKDRNQHGNEAVGTYTLWVMFRSSFCSNARAAVTSHPSASAAPPLLRHLHRSISCSRSSPSVFSLAFASSSACAQIWRWNSESFHCVMKTNTLNLLPFYTILLIENWDARDHFV